MIYGGGCNWVSDFITMFEKIAGSTLIIIGLILVKIILNLNNSYKLVDKM